ncbi:AAA family ATPase [Rhizobium ruizarguesonis]|uniref:AAA family ATPase n=1 Tax=Rhizobium ruizarguesonis TaxID=2081791 RepID=UPI001030BF14|nr:AAA family ATPase [Rhizobium ruizarguesonis]TBF02930.1 chromosome segregation protein SMC [Rhizobium ruizarguesonis]
MRILSISGQNIASLAQPFAIDFTAAPLAGVGLFAITGETGAGKSSILDALCLALYGDAPRLAGGASTDEVPDPSGDAIKAKDSRAILRRGATQGWAEVRFSARDGQDYIARWQARRARDRADGRLQSVSRSLARASDGQVLATQATVVTEQIEALTGFSYDEFRRTVLLAQGDFDAFLRADTNDRAALLEKVTGTELYRAISSRIYLRTEAARQAHETLTQRRAGHQLLSAEDRTALETERQALREVNALATAQANELKLSLERHARHDEARRQLSLAEAVEAQAVEAQAQAGTDRENLARRDRAAPLLGPWMAAKDAEARQTVAATDVETASATALLTSTEAAKQQEKAIVADAELEEKETEFKAFGPIWDQAAELDSGIVSATTELEAARSHAVARQKEASKEGATLDALRQDQAKCRNALTEAEDELLRRNHCSALVDRWDQIRQQIEDHGDACRALAKAETKAREHAAAVTRLEQALAELATQNAADTEAEAELASQSKFLAEQISTVEAKHPYERAGQLATLVSALADMARAEADHGTALAERAAAQAAAEAAAELAAVSEREGTDAAADLSQAEAQGRVLLAPSERADLATSDAARDLRLRLEPGKPCPVCGSSDHPTHADVALADLAASLRADLASARKAADTARDALAKALRASDRAQTQDKHAKIDTVGAETRIVAALALWDTARDFAQTIPYCPDLPPAPDNDQTLLPGLSSSIAESQQTEAAAQQQLATSRRELASLGTRQHTLRIAIANHATTRDGHNAEMAEVRSGWAVALSEAESARKTASRHAATLLPMLKQVDESEESLIDPALFERLAAKVSDIISLRESRERAAAGLSALIPHVATGESRAESARIRALKAQESATVRVKALEDLRTERGLLLDGEATGQHRTRHNEARKTTLAARDTARSSLSEALSIASAANASAEAARQNHGRTVQLLDTANAALFAALNASDLTVDDLATVSAGSREEIETLRQQLRALDHAVISTRAALASRRLDYEAALATGLPEEPADILTATLATLEATSSERLQRIGAIDEESRRDDATAATLAGLEALIVAARAELDVWQAVNHAVGSSNGDRFARVAQSITLDVLVDHANGHLADLNPRYRLHRANDLALQVEDRDMAGETRATRSLSGGERFLVSLALALALSRMGSKGGMAATLFIDEGFGSLDAGSLDLAIDALESLQSQGRQVGVISHVEAMKDRIPTRIAVRKQGGGKSVVDVLGREE